MVLKAFVDAIQGNEKTTTFPPGRTTSSRFT